MLTQKFAKEIRIKITVEFRWKINPRGEVKDSKRNSIDLTYICSTLTHGQIVPPESYESGHGSGSLCGDRDKGGKST